MRIEAEFMRVFHCAIRELVTYTFGQICCMLNCSALILRPAQPFVEWLADVDNSGILPRKKDEQTVYLIPVYEDTIQAMEYVAEHNDTFFKLELGAWHEVEANWPRNRSFEMFRNWFLIELHSMVVGHGDHGVGSRFTH